MKKQQQQQQKQQGKKEGLIKALGCTLGGKML